MLDWLNSNMGTNVQILFGDAAFQERLMQENCDLWRNSVGLGMSGGLVVRE